VWCGVVRSERKERNQVYFYYLVESDEFMIIFNSISDVLHIRM